MDILFSIVNNLRELVVTATPLQFGILAGILQVVGYAFYIRKTLKSEVEPNPATWLMFAYGTSLLAILEFDIGANLALLILPITCATLGAYVAALCWHRGKLSWPEDIEDRIAFIADLLLTAAYLGAWYMQSKGTINEGEREMFSMLFLFFSNATTITAFTPLLRGAMHHPHRERPLAWIVWSLAYVTLGVATYLEHGLFTVLMFYPVCNAILHGLVAWYSRPTRRLKHYLRKKAVA